MGSVGDGLAVEKVGAGGVGVGDFDLSAGIVEVVVEALAEAVDAVLDVHGGGKLLVGAGEAGFFQTGAQDGGLELVGEISPFVEEGSGAEVVFGDGGPFSEEGVVVIGDGFGVLGDEELGPVRDLVGGWVICVNVEGIVLEGEGVFEVGKLLVAEAGGFAERAGSAYPTDGGVFVGESALEGHDDVAAVLDVVGDALEQGVVGDVECGDDEQLIGGEVGGGGKDEVGANVEVVEGAVQLLDERGIAGCGRTEAPLASGGGEGHEADGVV